MNTIDFVDTYFNYEFPSDQFLFITISQKDSIPRPLAHAGLASDGQLFKSYHRTTNNLMSFIKKDIHICAGVFNARLNPKGRLTRTNPIGIMAFVLDDVGTKIPFEMANQFPPPTYIVETSPGNFQYVYVLEEPHYNIPECQAFYNMVGAAGYTDNGGRGVNKLIRLPFGINEKEKHKGFKIPPPPVANPRNRYMFWELVKRFGFDAEKVREAAIGLELKPMQGFEEEFPGESKYITNALLRSGYLSQEALRAAETSEKGYAMLDHCPWCDEHTDNATGAGFSPVGLGQGDHRLRMQFSCFHSHCKKRGIKDFVQKLVDEEVLEYRKVAHIIDRAAQILGELKKYFVVSRDGRIWDLRTPVTPYKQQALALQYGGYKLQDGKKAVSVVSLWSADPEKKNAEGATFRPDQKAYFFEHGSWWINQYIPSGLEGKECSKEVKEHMDFLFDMICPVEANGQEGQDDIKAWFAAKLRYPAWRPPFAMVSISHYEGTGRGTLGAIMNALLSFGAVQFTSPRSMFNTNYNEFLCGVLCCVSEFYLNKSGVNYDAAEVRSQLNEWITEPFATINRKFGTKMREPVFCGFFIQTNYESGLEFSSTDRRYYCFGSRRNPRAVEGGDAHYAWFVDALRRHDKECLREIRGYFDSIDVGRIMSLPQPPLTSVMQEVLNANATPLDSVFEDIAASGCCWPVMAITAYIKMRTGLDVGAADRRLSRALGKKMTSERFTYKGRKVSVRVPVDWIGDGEDWGAVAESFVNILDRVPFYDEFQRASMAEILKGVPQ
jgi:hypothetical protein